MLYSPLGEKGLAKTSPDGSVDMQYIAPYWAVLATDRDRSELVNMIPYADSLKVREPLHDTFQLNYQASMVIKMTFLTNKSDIEAGRLLVMPFDGGCDQIFSTPPTACVGSIWHQASD